MTSAATVFLARVVSIAAVSGLMTALATTADAQTATTGPVVSASISADPDTRWSVAGALGYRLSRVMTFGLQLTWNGLDYAPPPDERSSFATLTYSNPKRDFVSFTTNAKIEWPTSSRITPYGVFGGGVSNDRARVTETITFTEPELGGSRQLTFVRSANYFTLLLGGGASVALSERVSIDGDVQGFHFRGDSDSGHLRIAAGTSIRF